MKSYDIEVRHLNKNGERIDIHSKKYQAQIENAVINAIKRLSENYLMGEGK